MIFYNQNKLYLTYIYKYLYLSFVIKHDKLNTVKMENKNELTLEQAAQAIKAHLDYKLSGKWANDGVEKGKDPYQWMRLYDSALGVRCDAFRELFVKADKESKQNAVNIFLDQLNQLLDGINFPDLEDFKYEVTHID